MKTIPPNLDLNYHKDFNKVLYRIINYWKEEDGTFSNRAGEKEVSFYPTFAGMTKQLSKCDNGYYHPTLFMVGEKLDLSEENPKWTFVRLANELLEDSEDVK